MLNNSRWIKNRFVQNAVLLSLTETAFRVLMITDQTPRPVVKDTGRTGTGRCILNFLLLELRSRYSLPKTKGRHLQLTQFLSGTFSYVDATQVIALSCWERDFRTQCLLEMRSRNRTCVREKVGFDRFTSRRDIKEGTGLQKHRWKTHGKGK